jgi:hypothetical protein
MRLNSSALTKILLHSKRRPLFDCQGECRVSLDAKKTRRGSPHFAAGRLTPIGFRVAISRIDAADKFRGSIIRRTSTPARDRHVVKLESPPGVLKRDRVFGRFAWHPNARFGDTHTRKYRGKSSTVSSSPPQIIFKIDLTEDVSLPHTTARAPQGFLPERALSNVEGVEMTVLVRAAVYP